jgi:hypothetical protein
VSEQRYCIDASSLIELKRFDRDVFEGPWDRIEELIESSRLVAPIQVRIELIDKTPEEDRLARWVRQYSRMFIEIDEFQGEFIERMYRAYPRLKADAISPLNQVRADPFVLAVAAQHNCIVVTQEGRKEWGIPDLCGKHGLEAIKLLDMMKREGWRFR